MTAWCSGVCMLLSRSNKHSAHSFRICSATAMSPDLAAICMAVWPSQSRSRALAPARRSSLTTSACRAKAAICSAERPSPVIESTSNWWPFVVAKRVRMMVAWPLWLAMWRVLKPRMLGGSVKPKSSSGHRNLSICCSIPAAAAAFSNGKPPGAQWSSDDRLVDRGVGDNRELFNVCSSGGVWWASSKFTGNKSLAHWISAVVALVVTISVSLVGPEQSELAGVIMKYCSSGDWVRCLCGCGVCCRCCCRGDFVYAGGIVPGTWSAFLLRPGGRGIVCGCVHVNGLFVWRLLFEDSMFFIRSPLVWSVRCVPFQPC